MVRAALLLFDILWPMKAGPLFWGVPVQPNMLNKPKGMISVGRTVDRGYVFTISRDF